MEGWAEVKEMALLAERVGFDSVWLVDHLLYRLEGEEQARGVWECWSLVSAVAAITERVEIGTLVMAMGGATRHCWQRWRQRWRRLAEEGLSWVWDRGTTSLKYDAFGYPFGYKVSRFEEAIQIIHGLLRNGYVDFEGKYHSAKECELRPLGPRVGWAADTYRGERAEDVSGSREVCECLECLLRRHVEQC